VDYPYFNSLLTSQPFNSSAQPAIHSLDTESLNSLEHDTTTSKLIDISYKSGEGLTFVRENTPTSVGDLFVGSREKNTKVVKYFLLSNILSWDPSYSPNFNVTRNERTTSSFLSTYFYKLF
jgi:hypothetical protein